MNKIIVYTNPTAPFQKIIVFQDGIIIDQLGVQTDDVASTVRAFSQKYNIADVEFMGARDYSLGLMRKTQEQTKYSESLNIKYHGG